MERLFGRGKSKKSSTQNSPIVSNEDEGSGFAVVSNTPPPTGQQAAAATSIYPSVNSSPYPVLNPSVATSSSSPMNQGSNDQQSSTTPTVERNNSVVGAYLDGIPFSLSTKCIGDSNVDEVTARIERLAERIRCVDWNSTEYDFRLEKSVVNEDVNSMRMNFGFP